MTRIFNTFWSDLVSHYLFLCALAVLLTACATLPYRAPDPYNPVYTVAVLPMYNITNDVGGPDAIRPIAEKFLGQLHYKIIPLKEVDRILKDRMGITLGSQLGLTTPQELGRTLGVDGVLYGYLLNYGVLTAGIYNVNRVRAGFKFVDTKTGKVIWSRGQGVKSEIIAAQGGAVVSVLEDIKPGDQYKTINGLSEIPGISNWRLMDIIPTRSIQDAAIFSLGEKIVTKTFGFYLKPETDMMMNIIFENFPAGPGAPPETRPSVEATDEARELPRLDVILEYLMLGEDDFSSEVTLRSLQKLKSREFVFRGGVARYGGNIMADLYLTGAPANHGSPWPTRFDLIKKAGQSRFYIVYPEFKRYIESDIGRTTGPDIIKDKLGEEAADGHPCDKFKAEVTSAGGIRHQWFLWEAKDIKGLIVRAEFEDKFTRETFDLNDITTGAPAPGLFEVPAGYSKAADLMEVVGEKR